MTSVVYRYPIPFGDAGHVITVPLASKIVLIAAKGEEMNLWIDQSSPHDPPTTWDREFRVFGTGQQIPAGYQHRGSAVVGQFVWHVYERSQYPRD